MALKARENDLPMDPFRGSWKLALSAYLTVPFRVSWVAIDRMKGESQEIDVILLNVGVYPYR